MEFGDGEHVRWLREQRQRQAALGKKERMWNVRLDQVSPGSLVTLQLGPYGPDWEADIALFLGIEGAGDERRAKFISLRSDCGQPYEWEAYRYSGRWAYGTSADPLRLLDVADGITSCPADGIFR